MFGRIDNAASTLRANDLFCENEELHVDCSFYYYLKNDILHYQEARTILIRPSLFSYGQ